MLQVGGKAMHELDYSSRSLMQLAPLHPARVPDSIRIATLRAAYDSPGVTCQDLQVFGGIGCSPSIGDDKDSRGSQPDRMSSIVSRSCSLTQGENGGRFSSRSGGQGPPSERG